jgi:hypothetical protein
MNTGKTLFAQLMDFLPWSSFARIVGRYGGDRRVRTLFCAEQYRAMAFAQLTYRESPRDIETCLSVQESKLYYMGFREPIRRSTLADANETRDWRIYAELAERLCSGPEVVCQRGSRFGLIKHGLCLGFDDDRLVFVRFSMGTFQNNQSGC